MMNAMRIRKLKGKCKGCMRVGCKVERDTHVRGDFVPIRMKRCQCCIRNPKVRQKPDTFIGYDRVGDYYMSKSNLIHQMARRRGMGAICDDGHGDSRFLSHNGKPSYTKREMKYLKKVGDWHE